MTLPGDNFLAFIMLTLTIFVIILAAFAAIAGLFILAASSLLGFSLAMAFIASALLAGYAIYGCE